MNFIVISIIFSVLIGMIIIAGIRSYDIYEKETFIAMFTAFILGGAISVFIALCLYELTEFLGIDERQMNPIVKAFVIIGPLEELSKLSGLIMVYFLLKKQFNEVTDGVIYISCVALGFSIIENFFYANGGPGSESLLIFRAFTSTPAHISFSCIIGYAWYRYKMENRPFTAVIYALLVASLLHGIFDAIAFSQYFRFLLLFYLWVIIRQSLRLVQYSNIVSPFKPKFIDLFSTHEEQTAEVKECPYCRSKAPKAKFKNAFFTAYRCDTCGYHFSSIMNLKNIFRLFAPEYKRFSRKIFPVKISDKRYLSVYGSAFFDDNAEYGFFKIEEVETRIRLLNESIVSRFVKTTFIPKKLLSRMID